MNYFDLKHEVNGEILMRFHLEHKHTLLWGFTFHDEDGKIIKEVVNYKIVAMLKDHTPPKEDGMYLLAFGCDYALLFYDEELMRITTPKTFDIETIKDIEIETEE